MDEDMKTTNDTPMEDTTPTPEEMEKKCKECGGKLNEEKTIPTDKRVGRKNIPIRRIG